MKKNAGDRKTIIAPEEDLYVSTMAKKNRNVAPSQKAYFPIATGTHNSARTISPRLNLVYLCV